MCFSHWSPAWYSKPAFSSAVVLTNMLHIFPVDQHLAKKDSFKLNAPLCSWPVCTSTGAVELMADQAGIDSLPPSRFGTLVLACAAFSAPCLYWWWFQALELWSAFHTAVSVWLPGSESLPAPTFSPVSSSSGFVGSKSALQDVALGEQIHLVLDTCSL